MQNHFLNRETVLSSTSIRHLSIKDLDFGSAKRELISLDQFRRLVQYFLLTADRQARKHVANVRAKLKSNPAIENVILEVLMDHEYRKSPRQFTPIDDFLQRIHWHTVKGLPIEIIVPLFPCKVHNRLKSNGRSPDFAEVLTLLRLSEIDAAIQLIYPPGLRFTILADGNRFKSAWNVPDVDIIHYQERLLNFIHQLGLQDKVILLDYVSVLDKGLPSSIKHLRAVALNKARDDYSQMLAQMDRWAPNDLKSQIELAKQIDPDRDFACSNGRFVPLFDSTLYSIYFPSLYDGNDADAITKAAFEDIWDVEHPVYGQLRGQILNGTVQSAVKYIVTVRADRDVNPLATLFPNALRGTIHSKPGQLGLTTINKRTRIESWHSSGYIGDELKPGADFRISLESSGFFPVELAGDPFEMGEQPILYANNNGFRRLMDLGD